MISNKPKKGKARPPVRAKDDFRERCNDAWAVLAEAHEVFTVTKGESVERLGETLMQRAYYERVNSEAAFIEEDWRKGELNDQDAMSERINEIAIHGENDALDVLRWTDSRSAYEDSYGQREKVEFDIMACCALQEDVRDRLSNQGVRVGDPGEYLFDCKAKCGEIPCEEGDEECPLCGWVQVEERDGYVVDGTISCLNCLNDNEKLCGQTALGSSATFTCDRCDEHFRVG